MKYKLRPVGLKLLVAVCLIATAVAQQSKTAQDIVSKAPTVAIPDKEYVVGESDVLRINVWKEPEISQTNISVRPDGMISIPLIGVVKVSGQTPSQIQEMLTTKLERFIGKSEVTVSVVEVRSKSVFLTGEVMKPGVYPLVTDLNVVQLVIKGGGPTPYARKKSVIVLRNRNGTEEKIPVNLTKVLKGEAPEQNIQLLPGDTVVVP
jgi:polysaccharide biosynthesis/export protein